ncbi:hypothetical protein POM88_013315 [Heracleum sosnowskyi]|uniref:Uncharacterized protein n=1 Tax=Heracleum sosnowskyi TaxID=360622 RepID=A0AAD8IZR9_9APIA|nr:hypothetical protein POM88_013315 [Heracleum sosnowskyi]
MAPTNKTMSLTGFTYEKNNFTSLVDFENHPEAYHKMMKFINGCKLSHAILVAPTIYCEVVEEVWTSSVFDSENITLTFNLKGKEHIINADIVTTCLRLPENNCLENHTDNNIVTMLNSINYAKETVNLGKIQRKGMIKEWSFFCDAFIKVFSGKISNWDDVTTSMFDMIYMLLNDRYYDLGSMILIELAAKLGHKESRSQNIYFVRFIMLLANHVDKDIKIEFPANKMDCWVQNKRFFEDLNRMNLNNTMELRYLPIIKAFQVTTTTTPTATSQPLTSLISSATMEAGNVP